MKKFTSIVIMLLFGSISLFAQESVEQKKAKDGQKKLEEAKANHYKKLNEARNEMEEARADALTTLSKAQKESGRSNKINESLLQKGYSFRDGRNLTFVQGSVKQTSVADDNFKEVTYTIPFAAGTLELNFAPDSIEGYDGKDIILKSWVEKEEEAAVEGLVLINGNGLADNTGLGLFVDKKGESDSVVISELDMQGISGIKVMVPRAVKILVKYNNPYQDKGISLLNINSELEVAVRFNSITLKNITGSATVNTMHGSILAKFDTSPIMPVSLVSSYGNVDVTIPLKSKIDLNVKTSRGKMYIAESLVGTLQKDAGSPDSREQLKGKLNGGGNPFIMSSAWGKLYLRLK